MHVIVHNKNCLFTDGESKWILFFLNLNMSCCTKSVGPVDFQSVLSFTKIKINFIYYFVKIIAVLSWVINVKNSKVKFQV